MGQRRQHCLRTGSAGVDLSRDEHAPRDERAVAPPDDFYYASLFMAPPRRHALRVFEALRRAITDIPGSCSDRGVAHLKLTWWQTELQQLAAGHARHPLAHALLPLLDTKPTLLAVLEALLDATIRGLNVATLGDQAALVQWLVQQQGGVFDYYIDASAPLNAEQRQALIDIGALLELTYALRGLRQQRRALPLLLPESALRAAGLSADSVRTASDSRPLAAVLMPHAAQLRSELSARCAALPRAVRRQQRLLVTLAACAGEALALTEADACRVLERRIEMLPVRKLWLAWRIARWG